MGDAGGGMCELFADDDREFGRHASDGADDLFSILQTWEECIKSGAGGGGGGAAAAAFTPGSIVVGGAGNQQAGAAAVAATARPSASARRREPEGDDQEKVGEGGGGGAAPVRKKHKGSPSASATAAAVADDEGAAKMSHITVERNRRKQMNENLAVLRTLMPCFYVKRGDQASIIGGVVDYIKELEQVLHSLEAKKHRKVYAEQVLSPRPAPSTASPRPPPSPRPLIIKSSVPPLSPRLGAVPISPRTPTPGSPYKPCGGGAAAAAARLPHPAAAYITAPALTPTSQSQPQYTTAHDLSPRPYLPILDSIVQTELAARPAVAAGGAGGLLLLLPDVKVEFAGPNLVLKTMSHRAPGQVLRIIAALESLSLEILHVTISNVDDTMVHSFTIKIGIECELSAEELVHEIRQTFL